MRSWRLRLGGLVALVLLGLVAIQGSPTTGGDLSIDQMVAEARSRLTAPLDPERPSAVWATGSGESMGMQLTATFQFDDTGRFVLGARGPIAMASGYDGVTPWKQDASGATRVLTSNDAFQVLLPHWIITGFWAHPDAPFEYGEPTRRAGRGEVAVWVRPEGSPLAGDVFIDAETWLPKRFVANDMGMDHGLHFGSWVQVGERFLPEEVFVTNAGQEVARFVFTGHRPHDDLEGAAYAPPPDRIDLTYRPDREGRVATQRGRWGHLFVRPRINGEEVGWFAFDTGASSTSVDEDVARRLGLDVIGATNSTGMGGTVVSDLARIDSIELGPLRIVDFPIHVTSMDNISLGIADEKGLLGMDFLRHCIIEYDQKNSSIALFDPSTYLLVSGEWQALLEYNGKPTVSMAFENLEGLFSIDTGNPGPIIIGHHTVQRLDLLEGRDTTPGSSSGIGGRVDASNGRLAWVEWGGRRFPGVPAAFILENRGAGADRSRDGIIGADLLRRYRVVFDLPHGRIAYLDHTGD